jgi:hypothetical protein
MGEIVVATLLLVAVYCGGHLLALLFRSETSPSGDEHVDPGPPRPEERWE